MPYISVNIPVAAEWPSQEDMEARNTVIDELDHRSIGKFIGSGGGMGSMDFSYAVRDAAEAEAVIREVIAEYLPNREYAINVSED